MSWDSTMRKEGKPDKEMARIVYCRFCIGDTKEGTKFSLGGLYVHSIVKRVSKEALKRIKDEDPDAVDPGNGVRYNRVKPKAMGVTREHVIPVEELYKHFDRQFRKGELTVQSILDIMPMLEIAVITKEQNGKFKRKVNGMKKSLTRSMPPGWWDSSSRDPFGRYRAAGLDDSIWVKEFLQSSKSAELAGNLDLS